jgi:hypothetical protein
MFGAGLPETRPVLADMCIPVPDQTVLNNCAACGCCSLNRKTTLLRDVARLMSSPHSKGGLGMSVVVVDTSNEIAGRVESQGPGTVGLSLLCTVCCAGVGLCGLCIC